LELAVCGKLVHNSYPSSQNYACTRLKTSEILRAIYFRTFCRNEQWIEHAGYSANIDWALFFFFVRYLILFYNLSLNWFRHDKSQKLDYTEILPHKAA